MTLYLELEQDPMGTCEVGAESEVPTAPKTPGIPLILAAAGIVLVGVLIFRGGKK